MNDADLRQRLDALVDRVPPSVDAEPLVRRRASRLHRRRAGGLALVVVLIVCGAVAVPETLQHQTKSRVGTSVGPTPSTATTAVAPSATEPILTTTCTPALATLGREYGDIQHFYGLRTSLQEAKSWAPQDGATFLAVPPNQLVDFCLVVGDLDRLAAPSRPGTGEQHMHYAVLADSGGGAVLVESSPNPLTSPLPRTAASRIAVFEPTPAATGVPSAPAAVRRCGSADLVGTPVAVAFPDGVVQGGVLVRDRASTRCRLDGTFALTLLDGAGRVIAQKASLVMPPVRISGILLPGEPSSFLDIGIYGQPPGPATCATSAVVTPATFVLKVGAVQLRVRNHAAHAATLAVSGCPGTITADKALLDAH